MADYLVRWEIDVFDVDSPKEAAQEAWKAMRRPDSTASVFEVREKLEPPAIPVCYVIDLQEDGDEGDPSNEPIHKGS